MIQGTETMYDLIFFFGGKAFSNMDLYCGNNFMNRTNCVLFCRY